MRSMTVRWLLPAARRKPRPSCWAKTVGEAVGRSSRTQSTSGTSTPSPRTSTENTHRSSPSLQRAEALRSYVGRVVAGERDARDAGVGELAGHVARVLLGDAEAQRAHRADVEHDALDGFEELRDAEVVVREDVAELLEHVAAAAPRDMTEVGAVGDTEVLEGHEEALIDGFPEPQFDGDAMVEPLGHVLAVETLGRGGEAQQFLRHEVVEQAVVRRRGRVVELVDDHDVEGVRRDLLQPFCVERLDHREDVPTLRDPALAVDLAERAVAKHGAIRRQRLPEDLVAMRHEQQRQVATSLCE